ncbi:MAG: hypothetical protein ACJA19_001560, partial [Bacteroidia bacterium]
MINIEIWASGSGTNADVLMQHFSGVDDIAIVSMGCN